MADKQYSARYGMILLKIMELNVFGIPGAKIDYLFDALEDDGPN